ncbi:MADCA protein, partial [Pterocles burchelli]|nr:MADCA protein [Pterocles burchelli]
GRPANKLSVVPREPVVRYGGSVQLNCSLACAGGTVQWRGLDTNLGSVTSFPTHSVLHISHAVVATAGTKICQGTCQGQHYQHTADVKVYGEHPSARPSQPPQQSPAPPEAAHRVPKIPAGRCDSSLSPPGHAAAGGRAPHPAAGAAPHPALHSPGARPVTTPEPSVPTPDPTTALATTAREPDTETPLGTAAATESPSTDRPASQDLATGGPTARPATTTLPGSGTVSPPAQGTAADSIRRGSPPTERGTGQPTGTVPPCSLRIRSLPPTGTRGRALRIECQAQCDGNVTVRWLRTPVALSQYREEAAGGGSTLRLDRAEPRHQGQYQCVLLGQRSPAASLQLRVSDGSLSPGPAIAAGTTASLLGLLVAGAASRRLWKRLRSRSGSE